MFYQLLVALSVLSAGLAQTIPASPYGAPKDICPPVNGGAYAVDNFPGTPFVITPFKDTFANPTEAVPTNKVCRDDGHCMVSYEFDVKDVRARPFDKAIPACQSKPATWALTYGGQIPAPTITVPSGHESLVRFNNKISTEHYVESFHPCVGTRTGRPISVHFHGSASLAPYDGWADDETCAGETKDYVYPNNRPNTGWYHDHALHVTADNAYEGMAGMYIVSSKAKHGGCGEPYNLEDMEEKIMILGDKVLDNQCQFLHDTNAHQNNLYGDINTVNGIPFPDMPIAPKWYRFRYLNAAISRPYMLRIKDANGKVISNNICKIVATDGGYRSTPASFPYDGLLMGVAERYEVVCDFSKYAGKTLYIWNENDDEQIKDVPYFCYSHLVARLTVAPTNVGTNPAFNPLAFPDASLLPQSKALTQDDFNKAMQMVNAGQYHRRMDFGRSNGQWTINGETWDTFKIAATDVGQNTWEVWQFRSGGGWFHPIHMHLVDFFVLKRDGGNGVESFELMAPKDVFYLGPSNNVFVIARFGAHKGDYMFHCHNLIHEDNDMLRAFHMVNGEEGKNAVTANKFIVNPLYNIVYGNYKYADPMLGETAAKPTSSVAALDAAFVTETLNKNLYRIFYPLPEDITLMGSAVNPWQSKVCQF